MFSPTYTVYATTSMPVAFVCQDEEAVCPSCGDKEVKHVAEKGGWSSRDVLTEPTKLSVYGHKGDIFYMEEYHLYTQIFQCSKKHEFELIPIFAPHDYYI